MADVTLSQLFKDICDSIRNKTGKTDKIEHLKIPEEIAKISAGIDMDNWLNDLVGNIYTSVTAIPEYAFYKKAGLGSVTMPNVKSIGNYAFNYCTNLQNIDLPDTCTSLGNSAFMECYKLETITLSNGIKEIPGACFRGDWSLKNPKIPNSVTNIGSMAFQGCTFSTLDLARVAQLGQLVFSKSQYDATGITTLILRNAGGVCALSSTNSFTNTPIGNCDDNAGIYVPDNLVDDYKKATNWSVFASIIKPISELGA